MGAVAALKATWVYFIQWRLLSMKFWYAVASITYAGYAVFNPQRFDDAKFAAVVVNAFVGLAGHLWGQHSENGNGSEQGAA